ncbi:glycerol kinase, partial [Mycobacterium tuberculosis]|nr:glycerol kinase [Mycobacterium tuberculosis]
MTRHLIAIDQGTTSSRTLVFRPNLTVAGQAQEEFPQIFPRSGWVEHDPEDLWRTTVSTLRAAMDKARVVPADIGAI